MADGFDIHWILEPWNEMQVELQRASDRATMYALRAVGRRVAAVARSNAPVYHGDDPRAQAESGNLKRSIKSSRTIKRGAGIYEMKVMPVGSKKKGTAVRRHGTGRGQVRGVPLYRRKMEEKYGYMRAGFAVAEGDALAIFEEAYKKAFAKYAP